MGTYSTEVEATLVEVGAKTGIELIKMYIDG